jgi:hypothetical protein
MQVQEINEAVLAEAMSVAQEFAATFEPVPRDIKLTALAIFIAGTFKSPRNGLAEFRGLVDALIEHMNKTVPN